MARLDVNLISSFCGAGLEREAYLVRDLLNANDVYCTTTHYTNINASLSRADITIFFEVVLPQALHLSRENWFIPNSEWFDAKNDRFLGQFTKVLCKTKDCYRIWCEKVGPQKCVYTSFEARDIYNPDIPREVKCLHVFGKSEHKNTDAVLRTWRMTHLPHICPLPPLTVVGRSPAFADHFKEDSPFPDANVTYIPRATDENIIQLMNSHQIHIIPSMYEGFGHCLWEGLASGAIVLTTDAPPMNSYEGIWREGLIKPFEQTPRSLAQLHTVHPNGVNESVRKAMGVCWNKPDEVAAIRAHARESFLLNKTFFRDTFMGLVNGIR